MVWITRGFNSTIGDFFMVVHEITSIYGRNSNISNENFLENLDATIVAK